MKKMKRNMKHVFVLRHAQKNILTGGITKRGEEACKELAKTLPLIDIGIASEKKRTQETVFFLTQSESIIDNKANIEHESGHELVMLIRETMKKLHQNQNALIVTHSPCMIAAYYFLTKKEDAFKYLEGFFVDENGNVKKT